MLVLSRNIGQTLIIGEGPDRVTVTVIGVSGNQVKLGTDAPRHVSVHRQEIYDRIQAEKNPQPDPQPQPQPTRDPDRFKRSLSLSLTATGADQ